MYYMCCRRRERATSVVRARAGGRSGAQTLEVGHAAQRRRQRPRQLIVVQTPAGDWRGARDCRGNLPRGLCETNEECTQTGEV